MASVVGADGLTKNKTKRSKRKKNIKKINKQKRTNKQTALGTRGKQTAVNTALAIWLTFPMTPIGPKPSGTAVGFIGTDNIDHWVVKLGMDKTQGKKVTKSILSKDIAARGVSTDAIKEWIAAAAFKVLGGDRFLVPEVRLLITPILNDFTKDNFLAISMVNHLNKHRSDSDRIEEAMHVASKIVAGYQDLSDLVAVEKETNATMDMATFVEKHHRPPMWARVNGDTVRVRGIMEILAVSRLLADTDCLGGGFKNAGFVVEHVDGKPSVLAVKIDTGFSFTFEGPENVYHASFNPLSKRKMKDKRDIQFGNQQEYEIEFKQLMPEQRAAFMETFERGCHRLLDQGFMESLIWQDGRFNNDKVRVKTAEVEMAVKDWRAYVTRLAETYREVPVQVPGSKGKEKHDPFSALASTMYSGAPASTAAGGGSLAIRSAARLVSPAIRAIDLICIGKTGRGKSTIGNFFLDDTHKGPFKTSSDPHSCTRGPLTMERKGREGCFSKTRSFTDLPGLPDTDRNRNLEIYNSHIYELRKPHTAALFVFGKDKIDSEEYEEAGILFHEMNRLSCVKILVINDKQNHAFDSLENYQEQMFEQAKHIKQITKLTFDYTLFIPSAGDMKQAVQTIRETLKIHPREASPHLQTFEEIQQMVRGLEDDHTKTAKVKKDLLEQIERASKLFKVLTASASATAAISAVGGVVGAVFAELSLGASIVLGAGVMAVGTAASAAIAAAANAQEQKFKSLKDDYDDKGGAHDRLKKELEQKMEAFKKLCQKLHVDA